MIVGNLEEFEIDRVRGWILDIDNPCSEFQIEVEVNHQVRGYFNVNCDRPDVSIKFGHSGKGFNFSIVDIIDTGVSIVFIRVVSSIFRFPNNTKFFVSEGYSLGATSEIHGSLDIYNFPSELRDRVGSALPLSSDIGTESLSSILETTKIIIVLFSNRSGSNLVTDMLDNMGFGSGKTNEPFLADTILSVSQENCLTCVQHYIAATISEWSSNGVCFMKMGWDALFWISSSGIADELLRKAEFIFVRRHDKIAQAISYLKASRSGRFFELSGELRKSKSISTAEFWSSPRTAAEITGLLHDIFVADYRLNYYLCIHSVSAIEVYYEDIVDDVQKVYTFIKSSISRRLNVIAADNTYIPRLKKQASGDEQMIKEVFSRIIMQSR